jgi:hypothetical protein
MGQQARLKDQKPESSVEHEIKSSSTSNHHPIMLFTATPATFGGGTSSSPIKQLQQQCEIRMNIYRGGWIATCNSKSAAPGGCQTWQ